MSPAESVLRPRNRHFLMLDVLAMMTSLTVARIGFGVRALYLWQHLPEIVAEGQRTGAASLILPGMAGQRGGHRTVSRMPQVDIERQLRERRLPVPEPPAARISDRPHIRGGVYDAYV